MKLLKNKYTYLIIGCLLMMQSCDDYLDINDNPNNPTEAPLAGLMVNTTFETAQNVFRLGDITSFFVQYLASPNPASSTDIMDDVSHGNTWFNLYNTMTDLTDLIDQAETVGAVHYQGAGEIMLALNLGMTVDAWGDIPYSDALVFASITPSYDTDEELYAEVFRLLDAGIAHLSQETEVSIGDDDFIYQGDADKWIKLGNMLKARYLNHLSNTASYDPNAVLAAVDKGFESNADDAQVVYFEEQNNPWSIVAEDNANLLLGGWISEQLVESMDGTTYGVVDPRLPFMIGTTEDGEFVGTVNGAGRGNAAESGERSTLVLETFYASELAPLLIATYAEQKFIEAEAAFGIDKDRSYNAYLEGIRAHMEKIGVSEDEASAYISSPEVSMGVADFSMEDIFREKYIALFLHPEAWVDARRIDYDYAGFEPPANLNPALGGDLIRRLSYPDSETSRNGSNVPDVTLTTPIFWDE